MNDKIVSPMFRHSSIILSLAASLCSALTFPAFAVVPVIDRAVLAQTQAITKNTSDILSTDKAIKETTDKILEAVTGTRTDGNSEQNSALGSGFKFGDAPKFSDILGGGWMNFGSLGGDFQKLASTLITGMKFVRELKSLADGEEETGNQKSYEALINTATALAGTVAGSQDAVAQRSTAFEKAGSKIGQEDNIKGAVALNSMISLQQAQTMNEAIGVITSLNGAEQAKLMKQLAEESGTSSLLSYEGQ